MTSTRIDNVLSNGFNRSSVSTNNFLRHTLEASFVSTIVHTSVNAWLRLGKTIDSLMLAKIAAVTEMISISQASTSSFILSPIIKETWFTAAGYGIRASVTAPIDAPSGDEVTFIHKREKIGSINGLSYAVLTPFLELIIEKFVLEKGQSPDSILTLITTSSIIEGVIEPLASEAISSLSVSSLLSLHAWLKGIELASSIVGASFLQGVGIGIILGGAVMVAPTLLSPFYVDLFAERPCIIETPSEFSFIASREDLEERDAGTWERLSESFLNDEMHEAEKDNTGLVIPATILSDEL